MSAYKQKLNIAKFFMALINEEAVEIKKNKITKCLDEGANVNEQFENDSNNTPLHICVINGDVDIIKLLLERGAKVNCKNIEGKTALDIARELDPDVGKIIVALLEADEEETQINTNEVAESDELVDILSIVNPDRIDPKLAYKKRADKTGIKGNLYESKLLSLVLIRASLNQEFDEFYLGTSLDGIGALDDICIRYRNSRREGVIFLQAKHRSDVTKSKVTIQDLWRNEGDYSLQKYYNSYSMIRQKYWDKNDNLFFKGQYEDLKCSYVIYTTAECDFNNKKLMDTDSVDEVARDLINSGDYSNIFRFKYNENDVYLLNNMLIIDHMKSIGKVLSSFILKGKYDMLMDYSLIKNYHVMLARKVINVSDVTPAGYRVGTFRRDFLKTHDAKLLTLKLILYKEFVLAKKPNEAKIKEIINAVENNPSIENLSKLMQNALTITDETKTLIIDDDRYKDVLIRRFRLSDNYMLYSAAFDIAINEIVGTISFKLPTVFGNIDIAVANGNKGDKRLEYLAEKIEQLFDCSRTEPVIIEPRFVGLNGGLGSAVGNLLILDEQKDTLVLNTNEKTLGKNACNLLNKLKSRIKDMDSVNFNPIFFGFPCLTLDGTDVDRHKVRSFFDNLWFYSCQSKEDEIEKHAKDAMQDYCIANRRERSQTSSDASYDAIYFIIHDAVQKWWLTDEKSYYLTNDRQYLDSLLKQFSGKSLLNVISFMFVNKMRKYEIKFNKDSLDFMCSQVGLETTVLITEVMILTGIKLVQCYRNLNNYAFLDLNDVTCLSKNDYNTIIEELKSIKLKLLIIFYKNVTEIKNKIFLRLTDKTVTRNYILVTDEQSAEKLKLYIKRDTFVTLRDARNDLDDLDLTSQEKVLERELIYQGVNTKFSKVITHETKKIIKSMILQKIVMGEKIDIGKTLSNPYYEDIKNYYVQRRLRRNNSVLKAGPRGLFGITPSHSGQLIKINTLEALRDTVVIVGPPGMGKSTFLTYLSIRTKHENPSVWIERINLLDQTKELHRLQEKKINISKIDALKFVCKAAISRNLVRFSIKATPVVNFDLDIINGEVVLNNCDEIDYLVVFELKMFLHCYNRGNTILLFDGFDEVCPHYKKEITEILKCLVMRYSSDTRSDVQQRMWITGRSYNNVRETLETEFGVSYNLEIFDKEEQDEFIKKYLNINIHLNELNMEQFKRIDGFFEFMTSFINNHSMIKSKMIIKLTSFFLYSLYKTAMKYFYVEINKPQTPDKKVFCKKWSSIFNSEFSCYINVNDPEAGISKQHGNKANLEEAISLTFTPLHVYIVLDYFQNQIKNTKSTTTDENNSMKWDLEMNTSSFYEHFIETKLKKIRFQEKNQMDLYNPDIIMTYEKELKDFMDTHKKLAFYTTFKDNLNDILTEMDIEEIKEIIQSMERGREKTGIVDSILVDGNPKFIHLSFQEYLAAGYISDLFKSKQIEHTKLWRFITSNITDAVLEFLDRKLEFDDELMNAITERDVKQLIFDDFIGDRVKGVNEMDDDSFLRHILNYGLKHMLKMLLKAITDVVDDSNLDKFITFTNQNGLFSMGSRFEWDDILEVILNCIRRVDCSKLAQCRLGILQTLDYKDYNNKQIVKLMKWQILKYNNSKIIKNNKSIRRRKSI